MDIQLEYNSTGSVVGADFYPSYNPSAVAAWIFVALFALATVTHFILVFVWRSKFFLFMITGGIMEAFGYYGRAWSHDNTHSFGSWALQSFLIMCAPPLISATIYMSLGRIIESLDARTNAAMNPRVTTILLVLSDTIALISQLAGIGLQASTSPSAQQTGQAITLAGLIFQVVLLSLFILSIAVFEKRMRKNATPISTMPKMAYWFKTVVALYVACGSILLRNIVRLAEYAQGSGGAIVSHEAFIYVFDALLMWLSMAVLIVGHSGKLRSQAKRSRQLLPSDQEKSVEHIAGPSR